MITVRNNMGLAALIILSESFMEYLSPNDAVSLSAL